MNANIFGDEEFLSSYVTERQIPIPICSGSRSIEKNEILQPLGLASTSRCMDSLPSPISQTGVLRETISPLMIRPFPKAPPRKMAKGTRKKGRSAIITDTPEKMPLKKS